MNSSVEAVWAAQDSKKKKFEYFLATFFEGGFFIFTCMAAESFVFVVRNAFLFSFVNLRSFHEIFLH